MVDSEKICIATKITKKQVMRYFRQDNYIKKENGTNEEGVKLFDIYVIKK